MFNRLFILSIIVMLILFTGVGYMLYQQHTEEIVPSWTNLKINETPNIARVNNQFTRKLLSTNTPIEPIPTDRWEYTQSVTAPGVKQEFVEIPLDQLEFREITTPDGKVHSVPFPKGSEHIKGGHISFATSDDKLINPNSYFVIEDVQVPAGENPKDYMAKLLLSGAHDLSMEEVERRLEQGTLGYTVHSSNADWLNSIGGESEITNFLIEAGVSDTAIDQTLDSLNLSEESTSTAPIGDKGISNGDTSVESSGAVKGTAAEAPATDEKESDPSERYETEQEFIERYDKEEGRKRFRERDPTITDESTFKETNISLPNPDSIN